MTALFNLVGFLMVLYGAIVMQREDPTKPSSSRRGGPRWATSRTIGALEGREEDRAVATAIARSLGRAWIVGGFFLAIAGTILSQPYVP